MQQKVIGAIDAVVFSRAVDTSVAPGRSQAAIAVQQSVAAAPTGARN